MAFKLYLVRHGRTMLNHYRRLQGWCDSDLNDEGIAQANAAGRHLAHVKFDKIYYSGVGRTLKTAQLVIANNDSVNKVLDSSKEMMLNRLGSWRECPTELKLTMKS